MITVSYIRTKVVCSILLLGTFCYGCKEKKEPSKFPEPEKIASRFFDVYQKEKGIQAISYLFNNVNSSQVQYLKDTLTSFENIAGDFIGEEMVAQKSIGQSLVLYSYLVKFTNQPIHFTLVFYKAKEKWTIYQFKFDDDLESELEESAKIYYLTGQ